MPLPSSLSTPISFAPAWQRPEALLCCENHRVIGGLCSAAAEAIAQNGVPCVYGTVAVGDRFGEVGPADYLSKAYGLEVSDIIAKAELLLRRKKQRC